MSSHLEVLERMATRGSPRGSDVLIRDIRESLDDHPVATVRFDKSGRRPSGPVWAGVTALLVLAVGLVGGWVAGWGEEEAAPTGVSWHRVEAVMAASGPGGFVSAGFAADGGVWFSADGVSWEPASLPGGGESFVQSVLSTRGHWLVLADNEARLAWWSADGRVWSRVDWPAEIEGTIQQVAATGDHFFALSRDVFDGGATLWRSADAQTWTEIPTGPVIPTSGFLEGASGGLVFRDEADVAVSTDGTTWTASTITTPSELGEGNVRVETIEYLDDRWLAFIEVERVDQDPVLAVMSSTSGEAWEFEGIPPFGQLDDLAPGLQATGTIGDRLVAVPVETPTSTQEDGTVTADGFVRNSGQIWSTTDASEWTLELSENQQIRDVDGGIVEGRPVGIWIGLGGENESTAEPPVRTTTADMPDEPLDPDGLVFQAEVTEDGTVTFEEFEQAAEHWKTCMEDHGVTDVEYTIDRSGGMSSSFASPSPDGARENAIANLCYESWVNQVLATLAGP
jgi:hypothetical protein